MSESASEARQLRELYALVRYVCRKQVAEDIIRAFDEALHDKPDAPERAAIISHWLDFYRAHRYRKLMRRRRPTDQERLTACSACGYPISHRHHLWDIATHGENQVTLQLCANCHELHHLMLNALTRDSAYSRKLVQQVLFSGRVSAVAIQRLFAWCQAILRYEVEQGWLGADKLSDEWANQQLRWEAFLRQYDSPS